MIISVHCHDDLGMATANTLAGLRAGARQAEVTINGTNFTVAANALPNDTRGSLDFGGPWTGGALVVGLTAVDNTFVQFYPTLKPVAKQFGTYKQSAEEGTK